MNKQHARIRMNMLDLTKFYVFVPREPDGVEGFYLQVDGTWQPFMVDGFYGFDSEEKARKALAAAPEPVMWGSGRRDAIKAALDKVFEDRSWKAPESLTDPDVVDRWLDWVENAILDHRSNKVRHLEDLASECEETATPFSKGRATGIRETIEDLA